MDENKRVDKNISEVKIEQKEHQERIEVIEDKIEKIIASIDGIIDRQNNNGSRFDSIENKIEQAKCSINNIVSEKIEKHDKQANDRVEELFIMFMNEREVRQQKDMEFEIKINSLTSNITQLAKTMEDIISDKSKLKANFIYPLVTGLIVTIINVIFIMLR